MTLVTLPFHICKLMVLDFVINFSTSCVYLFMLLVEIYVISLNVCYHLEAGMRAKNHSQLS